MQQKHQGTRKKKAEMFFMNLLGRVARLGKVSMDCPEHRLLEMIRTGATIRIASHRPTNQTETMECDHCHTCDHRESWELQRD